MGTIVLTGATSGSTTLQPTDAVTVTCTLPATGGTLQTSGSGYTANGVAYASSTSALATGSALSFTGTSLSVNASGSNLTLNNSVNTGQFGTFLQYSGTTYGQLTMNVQTGEMRLISGETGQSGYFTTFYTSGAEAMRITSTGTVLIGTTTKTSASINDPVVQVAGTYFTSGNFSGYFWENRSTPASAAANWYGWYTTSGTIYLYNASSNIASINASSGAYTALSDRNKKKDFEDSTLGLSAVLQLKPTLYRMLDADENSEKELGFIAQDVKDVIPQAYIEIQNDSTCASGESSKFIGLNDRAIVATLTKAIQEQQTLIQSLTDRLTALENK